MEQVVGSEHRRMIVMEDTPVVAAVKGVYFGPELAITTTNTREPKFTLQINWCG